MTKRLCLLVDRELGIQSEVEVLEIFSIAEAVPQKIVPL
jgi:hypothetical protein